MECVRRNDKWMAALDGVRIQGDQWFPVKVDRVNKLSICPSSNADIRSDAHETIGKENNVAINKIRWLSKPSEKLYGSVVIYLAKKEDAERLLEQRVMDLGGETAFTRVFEDACRGTNSLFHEVNPVSLREPLRRAPTYVSHVVPRVYTTISNEKSSSNSHTNAMQSRKTQSYILHFHLSFFTWFKRRLWRTI
ncbi:hypothetical protein BJ546DRAFT_234643 [Cryomyces antarcticus]